MSSNQRWRVHIVLGLDHVRVMSTWPFILCKVSLNPCHADKCPLLIVSQSEYLIHIDGTNSHSSWQTVQIQKSTQWSGLTLFAKVISGISRTRVKLVGRFLVNLQGYIIGTCIRADNFIFKVTILQWLSIFYVCSEQWLDLGKTFMDTSLV